MGCSAEEHSSVARKLLHDMQSQSLAGMRLVQHLQVGCLMGCLTHLSLAGDASVSDDPGFGRDTLLTSQYAALFVANPYLEYLDLSYTGLTNNGIFYLILELSYCDPSVSPHGNKCLKQVVVGPPSKPNGSTGCREPFMKTSLSPLQELFWQSPVLELVCLVHPGALTVSPMLHAARTACGGVWLNLDENNQVTDDLFQGSPCSVLRTRKGVNAHVHMHQHRVRFSESLLPGTWIERHMKEAEEQMGALDELPRDHPAAKAQCQRSIPTAWRSTDTLQQQPHEASDGGAPMDTDGGPSTAWQQPARLPDLPLYHTGAGTSSGRSEQQSRLPYQADAGRSADRQHSRLEHRQHSNRPREAGGLKRSHVPQHQRQPQRSPHRRAGGPLQPHRHRHSTEPPTARRDHPSGPGNTLYPSAAGAGISHHHGKARAHNERSVHARHAGMQRPRAPARPRARNEAAEARQMYEQLWGVQQSEARAPRARSGAARASRPGMRTGNKARAAGAEDAGGEAGVYRGQGAIINLSDDGSQSDDGSAKSAPVEGSPPAAPHDLTDLTSPDAAPGARRLARSWSPRMHSSPAPHAQRAFRLFSPRHSHEQMDDMDVLLERRRSSYSPGGAEMAGAELWSRSLSPMEGPAARAQAQPADDSLDASPTNSSPLPTRRPAPQRAEQPSEQRRRRKLADLEGPSHARPHTGPGDPPVSRHASGHSHHTHVGSRQASKHGSIPLPRRHAQQGGKQPRKPASADLGTARERLFQEDDNSTSEMSGDPEGDGYDSRDEEEGRVQAAERAASRSASPQRGAQQLMTGAQRRRMKRLQEDQQLAEEDPEGWAHLQQTRAALMPYGWDKRKELHPIGAALDPTAFEADEPIAAAPPPQQAASHDAEPITAPRARNSQAGDSNSDDDFDPDVMQVFRQRASVGRQVSEPLQPPQPDAPVDAPAGAGLLPPSSPPLDPAASEREGCPVAQQPPPAPPAEACMPADVSRQASGMHAPLPESPGWHATDALPRHDAINSGDREEAEPAASGRAQGAAGSTELDAPASPACPQAGAHTDGTNAVQSAADVAGAPLSEVPPDLSASRPQTPHAPVSSPRTGSVALHGALAPSAEAHDVQQQATFAQPEPAASHEDAPGTPSASGIHASKSLPAAEAEVGTMKGGGPVARTHCPGSQLEPQPTTHASSAGPCPEMQLSSPACVHNSVARSTTPPVRTTGSVQADRDPAAHPAAPSEEGRGQGSMLQLSQTEPHLGTPSRSTAQPATAFPNSVELLETPEWLKEDAQDPAGGTSGTLAAAAEARMPAPPPPLPDLEVQRRSSAASPVAAPHAPPHVAMEPSTHAAGPPAQPTEVPAALTTSVSRKPLLEHAGDAPALPDGAVDQAATVPCPAEEGGRAPAAPVPTAAAQHVGAHGASGAAAAAKRPAPKSKVNKELARLTLFHWDKLAGEHPVGKQLAGIDAHSGARRTRRRSQSKKPAAKARPPHAVQPHAEQAEQPVADEAPEAPAGAQDGSKPCAAGAAAAPQGSTHRPHLTCLADMEASLNAAQDGCAQDAVASVQLPAVAVAEDVDKAASSLVVKERTSRLSALPMT